RRMRGARDLNLVLAYPDRLDHDHIEAGRVEDVGCRKRGARETSGGTASGHAANEHAWIEHQLTHADESAEDGSARERTGRVDRDDCNSSAAPPNLLYELIDECG